MGADGLIKSRRAFERETKLLLDLFACAPTCRACDLAPGTDVHSSAAAQGVMQLHDAWARYCRRVFYASACDGPVTMTHIVVPPVPGLNRHEDVWPALLATYPADGWAPKRQPDWHVAKELREACTRLGLANVQQISAGAGHNSNPEPMVRKLRNFYAHKNESTGAHIRAVRATYGIAAHVAADEVPFCTYAGRPLYDVWIARLRFMADVMIQ